jgi:hypothetical protein
MCGYHFLSVLDTYEFFFPWPILVCLYEFYVFVRMNVSDVGEGLKNRWCMFDVVGETSRNIFLFVKLAEIYFPSC